MTLPFSADRVIKYQQGFAARALQILEFGSIVYPRGKQCQELCGYSVRFEAPNEGGPEWYDCVILHPSRKLRTSYPFAEGLYFWLGIQDDSLFTYSKAAAALFTKDAEYGGRMRSGLNHPRAEHGPQVDQLHKVVQLLVAEPDTRQAVVSIYHPVDFGYGGDVPCTLTLQFLVRGGQLNMIVNMRSNDLFLGHTLDVFNCRLWQTMMARILGHEVGWLDWNVGSMHIYSTDLDALNELIHTPDQVDANRFIRFAGIVHDFNEQVLDLGLEIPSTAMQRFGENDARATRFYFDLIDLPQDGTYADGRFGR